MLRKRTMMSAGGAGEEFVDLGLPSGLLWAKGNLIKNGTTGEYSIGKETDFGTYVSWGNIDGHNEGEVYNFDQTTYDGTPGASVAADIPSNDAAHDIALARLSNPWHLPTAADFTELLNNTDTAWVSDYNNTGVAGRKFMKKSDHSVFIFLPASGDWEGTDNPIANMYGVYCSSNITAQDNTQCEIFTFAAEGYRTFVYPRMYGVTVRPVTLPFAKLSLHFQDGSGNAITNLAVTVTDGNGAHSMTTNASGNIVMNVVKGNVTMSSGAYLLDITTINVSANTTAVITGTSIFVDLGLPSGKKWAKGNLVKDANGNYAIGNETDWGTYVSWANIDGHNEGEGYTFDQTTYDGTPGKSQTNGFSSNDAEHDIAYARLGAPWHLPTRSDIIELINYTDSEWVANYNNTGVAGRKFMKKSDHSVFIFIPASGYYGFSSNPTRLYNRGTGSYSWTASAYSAAQGYALSFVASSISNDSRYEKYRGYTVRPVQ